MPMTSKLVFLFKRKGLALNLLQTYHLQGHRQESDSVILQLSRECERDKTKDSIGKKERSACGLNTLSGPCVVTEEALPLLSVVSIMCTGESWEDQPAAMLVWRPTSPVSVSPGVPTALLVLALLFFAAAAGLAICYVKRWGYWHMVGLIIFVASLSFVYPRSLLAFPFSKWRWQSSYSEHVPPHLTCPPYHTNFPTISAHACYPAWR